MAEFLGDENYYSITSTQRRFNFEMVAWMKENGFLKSDSVVWAVLSFC